MAGSKVDLTSAVEALEKNDPAALIRAYRGAPPGAVNAKVVAGYLGNAVIYNPLQCEEGDTMLHMAMRNKRWHCRRVLVRELAADSMIVNANSMTPPGMQVKDSSQRVSGALALAGAGYIKRATIPDLVYYVIFAFCVAATVDILLAIRWYWKAWSASYMANHPRTLAKAKKQAKAEAKRDGKGSKKK